MTSSGLRTCSRKLKSTKWFNRDTSTSNGTIDINISTFDFFKKIINIILRLTEDSARQSVVRTVNLPPELLKEKPATICDGFPLSYSYLLI